MKNKTWTQIVNHLKTLTILLLLSVCVYLLISTFVFETYIVKGDSMLPTLYNNQVVVVKKIHGPIQRGDIVIIHDPEDGGLSVKRIIGLPNETVIIEKGNVYVNTNLLDEPYLPKNTKTFSYTRIKDRFACSNEQYVLLGDNREVSADSRIYGVVPKSVIIGFVDQKNR